jgi:restriction system protein
MPEDDSVPSFTRMTWPTIRALRELGGSATIQELNSKVGEALRLSERQLQKLHGEGPETELANRAGWARTYLGKIGAVTKSDRGVWAITELGKTITEPEIEVRIKKVRADYRKPKSVEDEADGEDGWKPQLIGAIRTLSDKGFERLCQRILREKGLTNVQVTGRSGDGGIDGAGVQTVGLLSFSVVFQAKKWKNNVGREVVGGLRASMQGRAEKGLVITTAHFTPDAVKEANRTPPTIDLVDGDQLCDIMKELGLGTMTSSKVVEEVQVERDWFEEFEDRHAGHP